MVSLAAGGKEPTYYDALLPYEKNQQIWLCPSDLPNSNGKAKLVPPAMGYHMNGNLITLTGLAEAAVAAPSSCMLMRESGARHHLVRGLAAAVPRRLRRNRRLEGTGREERAAHEWL